MGAAYLKGPAPPEPKCTKNRHPDQIAAQAAARNAMLLPNIDTLALWTYKCRNCGWWHLTSSPQPGEKPITGA